MSDDIPKVGIVKAPVPERRTAGNPALKKGGKSLNPKGRPKGSKNKLTLYREAVLQKSEKKLLDNLPEILDVVIEAARGGDMTATKIFLDRVMAAKKVADDQSTEKAGREINIVINGAQTVKAEEKTIDAEYETVDSE